ncbi:MAG: hypothetical protein ACERKZ_08805 [Lachnotalea sp.]
MKNNLMKHRYLYLTLILAILPRIILCLFVDTLVYYPSDEVATVSGAALLAGYNWSSVVSTAGYYGQGFYSLFAPLYMLTDNPFIIFKVMIMVGSIVQGLTALVSYQCLKNFLQITNPRVLCAISVAASYLLDTRSTNLLNETPFMLMCWVILFILFKLVESAPKTKAKNLYTILLIVAIGYSVTLHTRAIILCIALVITVLFYYWTYKKWLVSPSIFFGLGIIGLVVGSIGIGMMQSSLWGSSDGVIRNTTIDINFDMLLALLKPYNWQGVVNIILGLLNTAVLLSFGSMLLCVVIFLPLLRDCLRRKSSITTNTDATTSYYVTGAVFFLSCAAIMIVGLAVKWLPGAAQGIQDGIGSNNYGFRAFVYFRYFAVFLSPLLMLVLAYVHTHNIRSYFKPATITLVLVQAYWMVCIVPYIYTFQDFEVKKFFSFSLFLFNKVNIWVFFSASVVLFITWFVLWYLYTHKKSLLATSLLAGLLLVNYCVFVIHNDFQKQETNYKLVNAGYHYINQYEDSYDLPNTIYVPLNKKSQKSSYLYQYFLMRYTIIPTYPAADCESALVLWNIGDDVTLLQMGYHSVQLDKNEYLYAKGEELISMLTQTGLHFDN